MRQLHLAVALLAGALAAQADIFYEEEVVHTGAGPGQSGARRTVYQVYIQGPKQRVSADIETSERMARVLVSQGKSLRSTTILRLDQGRMYDIDRTALTVRQASLPAARPAAASPREDPNRDISFRTRALPDSMEIAGILCGRVAVEMTARHFRPGTRQVRRTNRYLYQAWMAAGFPGYEEITSFQRLQKARTSLAPLAFGGGLGEGLEDPGRLEQELEALEGFPMSSRLDVFTAAGSGAEKQLLRLSRKVLRLSQEALPDSLFRPSAQLTRLR